jgi:hypothetical protein
MTWDELQNLHLEVAREVGAERSLHVQLAEPEDLHDPAFEFKWVRAFFDGTVRGEWASLKRLANDKITAGSDSASVWQALAAMNSTPGGILTQHPHAKAQVLYQSFR